MNATADASRPAYMSMTPLLTAEQVGGLIGLDAKTVYRYARDGVIPHKRIGPRNVRFLRTEVESWIAGL